VVCISKT